MTIKLYCFGESGNSYKAALPLELLGFDWEPVFVDFFNGEARSEAYRELNPMGEAPVLIDGDLKLTQSGVMQQWMIDKTGKPMTVVEVEDDVLVVRPDHRRRAQPLHLQNNERALPVTRRDLDLFQHEVGDDQLPRR